MSLSHALELQVIAEEIETQHQADCLTQLGIHYGQGNLFSKPLDGQAASDLVQSS